MENLYQKYVSSRLGLYNPEHAKREHAIEYEANERLKKEKQTKQKKTIRDVLFDMNPDAFTR